MTPEPHALGYRSVWGRDSPCFIQLSAEGILKVLFPSRPFPSHATYSAHVAQIADLFFKQFSTWVDSGMRWSFCPDPIHSFLILRSSCDPYPQWENPSAILPASAIISHCHICHDSALLQSWCPWPFLEEKNLTWDYYKLSGRGDERLRHFQPRKWVHFKEYKGKTGQFIDWANFNKWDPCIISVISSEYRVMLHKSWKLC